MKIETVSPCGKQIKEIYAKHAFVVTDDIDIAVQNFIAVDNKYVIRNFNKSFENIMSSFENSEIILSMPKIRSNPYLKSAVVGTSISVLDSSRSEDFRSTVKSSDKNFFRSSDFHNVVKSNCTGCLHSKEEASLI